MPKRLLILHDSADFGGHELIFFRFLPGLLAAPDFDEVHFSFFDGNAKLASALERFATPKLRLRPWRHRKRPGAPYLAGFNWAHRRALNHLVDEVKPDIVLLLQGRIENCATPLPRRPGMRVVGYIPMAHRLADMGRSAIGDVIRRRLYRRPDHFIVPSQAVADQIVAAGGRRRPTVIENCVTPPPRIEREAARALHDVPADRRIALFIGRLEVGQKGLDLLAEAIRRASDRLSGWSFVFVGEGDGRPLLETLQADHPMLDIQLVGWSDTPQIHLAAADVLLMPSRWEGVPLVMLEAIDYRVPILGSDIDVFREFLPAVTIFDYATGDIAAALDAVIDAGPAAIAQPRAAATPEQDARRFADALLSDP